MYVKSNSTLLEWKMPHNTLTKIVNSGHSGMTKKNCPIVPLPGCTFSHHLIGKWIPGKGMIIKIVPNGNMQSSSCLKIFENQIRVYLLQCHTSYCFSKVLMHRYEWDNRQRKKSLWKCRRLKMKWYFVTFTFCLFFFGLYWFDSFVLVLT